MNRSKLVATASLAIALLTMIAPIQISTYASPTTEDEGWVEGDYEGSFEEQEEQAQEDWEDAGRPGEIDDDNDENDNENDNDNSDDDNSNDDNSDNNNGDELLECEDGSLVETQELCGQSELDQDPCVLNPDLPECLDQDPCVLNPDLPECVPPIPCPDGGDPLPDGSCPPVICPDGGDPLSDGSCPPVICPDGGDPLPDGSCPSLPPPECGPGTYLKDGNCVPVCGKGTYWDNGKCVAIKRGGGGGGSGSSSSSSSSASATAAANVIAAEVSSCELDGKAHGIQQKFDSIKYQTCGSYPNAQLAYSNGFITGCMQVGNTQQLCQAFVNMNIQPQTQLPTQTTTQPPQAIQPAQ
jgi:hypothetical protein